jgi:mono/diheme cytochrome c family protein
MLQRMLIERMENRILVGITMFVGTMVLLGWVAINENARMASFERQFHARSIERGAELFAANCATCHGEGGRGIQGFGPALNSPHLFGHNYFAEIDQQLDGLEQEEIALQAELADLADELVAEGTSDERMDEILERRREISERISGEGGINEETAALLEQRDAIIQQLEPAVDAGYPIYTDFDEDGNEVLMVDYSRLDQVAWGGTLYDFVFTTLVHGRPTSISYWEGNQMVAWSQRAGGALRDDELADLTNYILNWDRGTNWTIEDALAVNQYAIVPGLGDEPTERQPAAGTDVAGILNRIETEGIVGDPDRGQAIYTGAERSGRGSNLGCSGCHMGGVAAPDTEGTWDRTVNERLQVPELAGYTPEQYIVQSIVRPGDYPVPGWAAGVMPGDFGQRMTVQDIADVTEYLRSYSDE